MDVRIEIWLRRHRGHLIGCKQIFKEVFGAEWVWNHARSGTLAAERDLRWTDRELGGEVFGRHDLAEEGGCCEPPGDLACHKGRYGTTSIAPSRP